MKRTGDKCWFSYTKEHVGVVVACAQCGAWYVETDMKPGTYPYVVCVTCFRDSGKDVQMEPVSVIKYSRETGVVTEPLLSKQGLVKVDS